MLLAIMALRRGDVTRHGVSSGNVSFRARNLGAVILLKACKSATGESPAKPHQMSQKPNLEWAFIFNFLQLILEVF
jgi:hypothetical protein